MYLYLLAEAEEGVSLAPTQKAQLFMVVGFLLLGWVLARRQMKLRKRVNGDARVANRELEKLRKRKDPVLPLADAPPETLRWQGAMFDLQRELKAELDTRIVIVQTLMRQLDQRMEKLASMQAGGSGAVGSGAQETMLPPSADFSQRIRMLSNLGHTSTEIASQTGVSVGDVELTLSATQRS